MTVNPLVSIAVGLTVFADHLRTGPVYVAVEVAGLALLCVGAVVLTQSPLVAGAVGADEFLGRGPAPLAVPPAA